MDPRLWALISRYAPRYGLDPRAVAAVAMNESGGRFGAVGDSGSSYGPWQLHRGGALPAGRNSAWANSLPGILYALRQMGSVAHGLTGRQAISAIATRFERPADPGAEIRTALGYYGRPGFARSAGGGVGPTAPGAPPPAHLGPPPQFVPPTFTPMAQPNPLAALQNIQALEPAVAPVDPNAPLPFAPSLPSVSGLNDLHTRLLHG